jgi:hypothetical protein
VDDRPVIVVDLPSDKVLIALRLSQAALATRLAQLSACKVCGEDTKRFEQALKTTRDIIQQVEEQNV